ncbi:MAG: GNAT family N-acetyltransferase [Lysinibacillus sp.]
MYLVKIVENKKEYDDAFTVRTTVFVKEQGVPVHLELDEHDKTATHFIIYDHEQPIGAARLRIIENGVAKVERVSILLPYRGKKLGVLIMNEIEKHAAHLVLHTLKLHAQSYAIPFYEKLGYTVTSPEFMDAGIPHRSMEKNI